jgi:Glycosyltransferase family 87
MSFTLVRPRVGRPPTSRGLALAALASGALVLVACAVTTLVALSTSSTGDYQTHGVVGGDNAGPAIAALLHANIAGYFAHQPVIGLTSIVLRLPFAGLASLLGAGELEVYRLGAAACLLPLGMLAAWLVVDRRSERFGRLPGLLAAAVLLLSPAVADAVHAGHPEEVLAGVLATGAVIAATRGHSRWAAVMLGLAVGAKPWALIAAPAVLMATPGQRLRTAAIAGGLAAVLAGTAPLADPAGFFRTLHGEGATHLVNAFSLWWPLSSSVHLASGVVAPARLLPLGMTRSTASVVGSAVALPLLTLGWARARRRGGACDALALLALLGIVRCAVDPTHLEYYYVAALIPLAAWEVVGLGRLPLLTVLATVAVALSFGGSFQATPAALSAASIAATLILVGYLAHLTFHGEATGLRSRRAPAWRSTTGSARVY